MTTPRATAASNAFSSSGRSKRKMTISMDFFARRTAFSSGVTPSSGWMISFTRQPDPFLLLLVALVRPVHGEMTLRIEAQDRVRHTIRRYLERHANVVTDLVVRGGAQFELA